MTKSPAGNGVGLHAGSVLERRPRGSSPVKRRLLIGFVVLWFALIVVVPLLSLIKASFSEGITAFFTALNNPLAIRAFAMTTGITVISVVINTFFGVLLALMMTRQRFYGKTIVDLLIDLPLAVSPVVAGFMFIILFGPSGWLGHWFEAGGIKIVFALPGMILVTLFVTLPFVSKEVIPVLEEIGAEQEEAARTLGASSWQTFWLVTVPSIRWGLAYGVTLTIARSIGEFGAVLVVSGSIIGKTQTATLYIHQEFIDFHYVGAYATSLVLAVVSFLLLVVMELLKKRVHSGKRTEIKA